MYRCEECGSQSKKGEAAFHKVVSTRLKNYPFRKEANRDGSNDAGGNGTEIVKEKLVCESCSKK